MSESDKNRWAINRLDKVFTTYEKFTENHNESFEKFKIEEIKRLRDARKSILAVIGFLISLIIGLYGVNLKIVPLESSIAILLYIGLAVYVITAFCEKKVDKILGIIQESGRSARNGIYFVEGYMVSNSLNENLDSSEDYHKLMIYFVNCVDPSFNLGPYYTIQKYIKSLFLSKSAIKYLKNLSETYKKSLDTASAEYDKNKDEFEKTEFLEPLLFYGRALLDYKIGKKTIPSHDQV